MATGKRYYWIKLYESFLTGDVIDFFMSKSDGANYVVLYELLCIKTVNTSGRLETRIGEVIVPFNEEKIQRDCKYFSIDTIRIALGLYKALGLVYEDVNGTLVLSEYKKLVGSETDYSAQKRLQREEQQKQLSTGVQNAQISTMDNGVDGSVDNVHTNSSIVQDAQCETNILLQNEQKSPIDNGVDSTVDNGVDNVHTDIEIENRDIDNIHSLYLYSACARTREEKDVGIFDEQSDKYGQLIEDPDGPGKRLRPMFGDVTSLVLLTEEQEDDLLKRLSIAEFDKYTGIVHDCELSGKHYTTKTHYQAILEMAEKDRRIRK